MVDLLQGTSNAFPAFPLTNGSHVIVSTTDIEEAGEYEVRITADFEFYKDILAWEYAETNYESFTVIIEDPCISATLTIDPQILSSSAITYNIGDAAIIESLDLNHVISSETITTCPPIVLTLINQNTGTHPDSEVFNLDSETSIMTIYTNNTQKQGIVALNLQAQYEGIYY